MSISHRSVDRLCVFVREPRLGAVKTRLAASMGDAAALTAYLRLVDHAIQQLQPIQSVSTELWVAGDGKHAQVQRWASVLDAKVRTQPDGNLGQRMHRALYDPAQHAGTAVLVGTDCPPIDSHLVAQAIKALHSGTDVAIAPAEDGGYGLIAVAAVHKRTFQQSPLVGIEWGSPDVFRQTTALCQRLGLTVSVLPVVWDVDTEADWQRFQASY